MIMAFIGFATGLTLGMGIGFMAYHFLNSKESK